MSSPYTISASPSADGERVTVTVERDDHEGKYAHVYRLTADDCREWQSVVGGAADTAKARRKAIRKAAAKAGISTAGPCGVPGCDCPPVTAACGWEADERVPPCGKADCERCVRHGTVTDPDGTADLDDAPEHGGEG